MASSVTRRTVVSYTAFPPLPQCCQAASGGISLLHYPWSRLHRTLSGILPYEARTFLTCFYKQPRSSVLLAPCYSSTPYLFCQTVHSAPFAKPSEEGFTALSALSAAAQLIFAHEMALPTYIHAGRSSCETEKSPQECTSEL